MSDPQTDGRWRLVKVRSDKLDWWFRGQPVVPNASAPVPDDLQVVGLNRIETRGDWHFVVWSATFEALPMNADGRLMDEIPFADFEY